MQYTTKIGSKPTIRFILSYGLKTMKLLIPRFGIELGSRVTIRTGSRLIPKTGTRYMLRRIRRTGLKITRQITQLITARHIQKHMKLTIQETSSSYGKVSIQRTMTKIT